MDDKFKEFINKFLIEHPEEAFHWQDLTHKSSEMNKIIDRFELAAEAGAMHQAVITLLQATIEFRADTRPVGIFAEIRQANFDNAILHKVFSRMENAFAEAEKAKEKMTVKDKHIFEMALHYCRTSVKKRISQLKENDKLMPLWQSSSLKVYLDQF